MVIDNGTEVVIGTAAVLAVPQGETLMIRERHACGGRKGRSRMEKKGGNDLNLPCECTRTDTHTYPKQKIKIKKASAHSSLQAKTEAVARAVCLCKWWAVRSQVRPTQSPFSRTVCSTHWLHRGQNGRRNKEELMHALKGKTHTHISTHKLLPLTKKSTSRPFSLCFAAPFQ